MNATATQDPRQIIETMETAIRDPEVAPGQPACFTDAAAPGDAIAQGDLLLLVVSQEEFQTLIKQSKYTAVSHLEISWTKPTVQLVIGNTEGAKHCLDSLDGVEMVFPNIFDSLVTLRGPMFQLHESRTVLHPVHGDVTIPAGFCIQVWYQREHSDSRTNSFQRAID